MSVACMGRKHSPETCLKMSQSHKGRKHTIETRQKMSTNAPRQRQIIVDGHIYPSIKTAALTIGLKPGTLLARFLKYKRQNKFPVGWGYIETVI